MAYVVIFFSRIESHFAKCFQEAYVSPGLSASSSALNRRNNAVLGHYVGFWIYRCGDRSGFQWIRMIVSEGAVARCSYFSSLSLEWLAVCHCERGLNTCDCFRIEESRSKGDHLRPFLWTEAGNARYRCH